MSEPMARVAYPKQIQESAVGEEGRVESSQRVSLVFAKSEVIDRESRIRGVEPLQTTATAHPAHVEVDGVEPE